MTIGAIQAFAARIVGRELLGVTLWDTHDSLLSAARATLPSLRIGAGSPAFFAELNRTRPLPALAD